MLLVVVAMAAFGCRKDPQNGGGNGEEEKPTTGQLNGHDWVDLGLPSGTLWATCNVGASAPEEYGNYFAWGETTQQSDNAFNWESYKYANGEFDELTKYCSQSNLGNDGYIDTYTELFPSDDAATANWGTGWRMPTRENFAELMEKCSMAVKTQNGVLGCLFTASNGNTIFLPFAGLISSGQSFDEGESGIYWTKSLFIEHSNAAWHFYFLPDTSLWDSEGCDRCDGHTIRPVCSVPK